MVEAIAQEALGDPDAAGRAVERALDLAEAEGALSAFLICPAPGLLERHARDCTKHAALISEILTLLPTHHGSPAPGGPGGMESPQAREGLGWNPPCAAGSAAGIFPCAGEA
jgi:LuxR family maltose regulon positive regulatory protein